MIDIDCFVWWMNVKFLVKIIYHYKLSLNDFLLEIVNLYSSFYR